MSSTLSLATPVRAGAAEARHQPRFDRIGTDPKHDRNCRCCGFSGPRRHYAVGDDNDPNIEADEVGGKCGKPIVLSLGPAVFDGDIPAFAVACLTQTFEKHTEAFGGQLLRSAAQIADHGLLRACPNRAEGWQSRRRAKSRNEIASSH